MPIGFSCVLRQSSGQAYRTIVYIKKLTLIFAVGILGPPVPEGQIVPGIFR